MTKILKLLSIIMVTLLVASCATKENSESQNYDLAIMDINTNYLFEEDNDELILVKKENRGSNKLLVNRSQTKQANDGAVFWGVTDNKFNDLLGGVDEHLKPTYLNTGSNNVFSLAIDDDYVYSASALITQIEFLKTDRTLNNSQTYSFKFEDTSVTSIIPVDMRIINEHVYVLVAKISNLEQSSENSHSLLKMDKYFNLLEEIVIGNPNGGLLSMVYHDNIFYFTETNHGKTEQLEPAGSNRIIMYLPIENRFEYIYLDTYYPKELYLDEENNKIVIRHYSLYIKANTFTVLSVDDHSTKEISFEQYVNADVMPSYFTIKDNKYYFMFDDELYKYDTDGELLMRYDLMQYNMERPLLMFVK